MLQHVFCLLLMFLKIISNKQSKIVCIYVRVVNRIIHCVMLKETYSNLSKITRNVILKERYLILINYDLISKDFLHFC